MKAACASLICALALAGSKNAMQYNAAQAAFIQLERIRLSR
jgi:hypothetical protein